MTAAPSPDLGGLLLRLFAPDALERFVAGLPRGADARSAVVWTAPADVVAAEAAAVLARHSLVDDVLFVRLLAERPGQSDAIAGVYEAMFKRRLGVGDLALVTDRHPALSDDLREGLRLCAGHGFVTGWGELSTTTVFQVYRWRHPWVILAFPEGTLRDIEPGYTGQVGAPLAATLLSECVRRSVGGLCAHAPPGVKVTFHDLFFDLARFGTGRSVQRLRDHGVGLAELRGFADRLGFGRLTRHGPLD